MRFDANGVELKQLTVWVTVPLYRLIRADRINVNRFVNEQFEAYYGPSGSPPDREQLAKEARESIARQYAADLEREGDLDHAQAAVRAMRADRDAVKARQDGITEALLQIVDDDEPGRLARLLPENDPHGDRADNWDALVRRVSQLCGAEIDSAEVVTVLKTLIAKA